MASQDHAVNEAPTGSVDFAPRLRMTEDEFVAWHDEDVRAEWVDGEVIMMSPVNVEHAALVLWLTRVVADYVDHHGLGEVLGPEVQIRLASQRSRRVPDAMFVSKARANILQRTHIDGPPDLAIEVVSPDSQARDWREKYLEYQAAGVPEYWIIDPNSNRVEAYRLLDNAYRRIEEDAGVIASSVLAGFYLRTAWLWRETRPKVQDVRRELKMDRT